MADYSNILNAPITTENWGGLPTPSASSAPSGSSFDWGGLLSGGLDLGLYYDLRNRNQQTADTTLDALDAASTAATDKAAFTPYGVTSNLGSSQVRQGPKGRTNITHTLDPTLEAYGEQFRDAGAGLMAQSAIDPTQRENSVYNEILASMAPERERSKQALDSSLWNTGRGGVSSAATGGSPEQLAFFKAIEEANLGANISAKDFNMREQDALYQRGSGLFNTSFAPNEQMRKDFGLGTNTAQLANTANQAQGDLMAQMALGRAGTKLNFSNLDTQSTMDLYNAISLAAGGSGISSSGSSNGGLVDFALKNLGIT